MPTLTVLVPSYREDARVVRQTLLSAALQEYPDLRIVLLIDDPPSPNDPAHGVLDECPRLARTRSRTLLAAAATACEALERFERPTATRVDRGRRAARRSPTHYDGRRGLGCATRASSPRIVDHADAFFADARARAPADDLRRRRRPAAPAAADATGAIALAAAQPAPPPAGLDLPRRADELRAQAVRLASRTTPTRR